MGCAPSSDASVARALEAQQRSLRDDERARQLDLEIQQWYEADEACRVMSRPPVIAEEESNPWARSGVSWPNLWCRKAISAVSRAETRENRSDRN